MTTIISTSKPLNEPVLRHVLTVGCSYLSQKSVYDTTVLTIASLVPKQTQADTLPRSLPLRGCQEVASFLYPEDRINLELFRYEKLSISKRDLMLGQYLSVIGLTQKPEDQNWHHYLSSLLLTANHRVDQENSNVDQAIVDVLINKNVSEQVWEEYKNDKHFVKVVITMVDGYFEKLDENLRKPFISDENFMRNFVYTYPKLLKYASDALKNDFNFAMVLVQRDGSCLKYVSDAFKNDRDIVMAALENNPLSFRYAGDEIKDNMDMAKVALKEFRHLFAFLSERLRKDPQILSLASELALDRFWSDKRPSSY